MANALHTTDSLRQHEFRYPALVPTMPWLDAVPPRPAENLTLTAAGSAHTLTWQPGPAAPDGDLAAYYALYRFTPEQTPRPDDPRNLLAVVRPRAGYGLAFVDTSPPAPVRPTPTTSPPSTACITRAGPSRCAPPAGPPKSLWPRPPHPNPPRLPRPGRSRSRK